MSHPLINTRNIILDMRSMIERATDPTFRKQDSLNFWSNILMEHIIRPNPNITLNSARSVDSSLNDVDLSIRYFNLDGKCITLCLLQCEGKLQIQDKIQQLEDEVNEYAKFVFLQHGVAASQPIVYAAVAFGPLIRLFQITKSQDSASETPGNVAPIWGGEAYDAAFYKDVCEIGDAGDILQAFQEIANIADFALSLVGDSFKSIDTIPFPPVEGPAF